MTIMRYRPYTAFLWIWGSAVLIGWMYVIGGTSRGEALDVPSVMVPPGTSVTTIDVQTGDSIRLFTEGRTTAGAIITMECAACRQGLQDIVRRLVADAGSRKVLVSLDPLAVAIDLADMLPEEIAVVRLADDRARLKFGKQIVVPTFFSTNEMGVVTRWKSGLSPTDPDL